MSAIFLGAEKPNQNALVVDVPIGIMSKAQLLLFFERELGFSGQVGKNWDAFEEALADLSWIGKSAVVLSHVDVPLVDGSDDQKTYLDILRKLSRESLDVQIYPAFPAECKKAIEALIGVYDLH